MDVVISATLCQLYPTSPNADMIAYAEFVNNYSPSEKILAQRKRCFVLAAGVVYDVERLEDFLRIHELALDDGSAAINKEISELSGSVACQGKARGKVKIILFKRDIPSFKQGEILVTAMTTPEFLPAMKKAAAIVTDEGGITCHAAIVSRELGIPCVIGTKVATKILKDDDLVEVDAEMGIVRFLSLTLRGGSQADQSP